MRELALFGLMFVAVLATLGVIVGWGKFVEWRAAVKTSQRGDAEVMSNERGATARTERTNERTNERSSHDPLWQAFLLDRTRVRLIAVMVDSDMTVSEIRGLLKGTSETVGEEIEAERQRQGKAPTQPYQTPIAGRPTNAKFHDDPELEYQPLR